MRLFKNNKIIYKKFKLTKILYLSAILMLINILHHNVSKVSNEKLCFFDLLEFKVCFLLYESLYLNKNIYIYSCRQNIAND